MRSTSVWRRQNAGAAISHSAASAAPAAVAASELARQHARAAGAGTPHDGTQRVASTDARVNEDASTARIRIVPSTIEL